MTTADPASRPAPEPASILVRAATSEDAVAIQDVAAAAWRATYAHLISEEAIERFVASAYTAERITLRIERHAVLVAGVAAGPVEAFAETVTEPDHVQLVAIYARPDRKRSGLGSALLDAMRVLHPGEDIAADVLVGNAQAEPFYLALGFRPGELLTEEIAGVEVLERRWWLRAAHRRGRSPGD